jgi:hypothetical protein
VDVAVTEPALALALVLVEVEVEMEEVTPPPGVVGKAIFFVVPEEICFFNIGVGTGIGGNTLSLSKTSFSLPFLEIAIPPTPPTGERSTSSFGVCGNEILKLELAVLDGV